MRGVALVVGTVALLAGCGGSSESSEGPETAYLTDVKVTGDALTFDFKSAPLFILVGADDKVAASWRKVESKWIEAGVPLTIRYVKGKGHEWLFGPDEKAALQQWLDAQEGRPD